MSTTVQGNRACSTWHMAVRRAQTRIQVRRTGTSGGNGLVSSALVTHSVDCCELTSLYPVCFLDRRDTSVCFWSSSTNQWLHHRAASGERVSLVAGPGLRHLTRRADVRLFSPTSLYVAGAVAGCRRRHRLSDAAKCLSALRSPGYLSARATPEMAL